MLSPSAAYLAEHNKVSRTPIYQVRIYGPRVTRPSLWFPFDEVSGDRSDVSGAGAVLTDGNTVGSVLGKKGNAAVFVKANNEYLSMPSTPYVQPDIDFTAAGWIYTTTPATLATAISIYGTGATQEISWRLILSGSRFGILAWNTAGANEINQAASTFGVVPAGVWCFVMVRHELATKTWSISVNAGARDSATYTGTQTAGSGDIFFGARQLTQEHWDGGLDEWAFWRGTVLTTAEEVALYNAGTGRTFDEAFDVLRDPVGTFCTSWPANGEDIGQEILGDFDLTLGVEADRCRLPVTTLEFDLIDLGTAATSFIRQDIFGYRVDLLQGFWSIPWTANPSNFLQRFSGRISDMSYQGGRWRILARGHIAAAQDKNLFSGASSRLASGITNVANSLTVTDASAFGSGFDLPQRLRGALLIDDEIMIYRSQSGNTFNDVLRSGAEGFAVPPRAGASVSHSAGATVREIPKLGDLTEENDQLGVSQIDDLHPMELLQTMFEASGKYGFGEAAVRYDGDEMNAAKAVLGPDLQYRFMLDDPVNAKRFIEEEFFLTFPGYPKETALGEISLKVFSPDPALQSPPGSFAASLTDADILETPQWIRNSEKIMNKVVVHYDYMPDTREYTSQFIYLDETRIAQQTHEITLEIFSKGIRSEYFNTGATQQWFKETSQFLLQMSQRWIDRFGGISPLIRVPATLRNNLLELGDDVQCTFTGAIDMGFGTRTITNESFEVVGVRFSNRTNRVELDLLGYPSLAGAATLSVSDGASVTETVTIRVSAQSVNVSDAVTVSETLTIRAATLSINASDSATITETITVRQAVLTFSVSDSTTVNELFNTSNTRFINVHDIAQIWPT